MKTLIQKELRENLKFAAIGFLLSIIVVVGTQLYYVDLIEGIASGISAPQNYYYRLQPLTSGNFELFSALCCVLVAAMLGWFQVNSERHRDLWAFLVHRPVTRTDIFLSKTIVGLLIYFLSVGLPFAWFIFWVKTPGHVAAPFAWGMVVPVCARLLAGVAWYFAAMLTSIRQARWYGSRALGLMAAFFVSIMAEEENERQWLLMAVIILTLAIAVWGAFHNRGQFQGQPGSAKAALTLALTPGTAATAGVVVALVIEIFLGTYSVVIWPHYAMGRDGIIYKIIQGPGVAQVLTLDGQPMKDPATGAPMEVDKFNRTFTAGGVTATDVFPAMRHGEWFAFFLGDRHTLWFDDFSNARLVVFDLQTRRCAGSIGPDGFAADERGDGSGFLRGDLRPFAFLWKDDEAQILASSHSIYRVDINNRSVQSLWTTSAGDVIEACSGASPLNDTLVITRSNILMFNFRKNYDEMVWSTSFSYSMSDYPSITLYMAGDGPNFDKRTYSVWISPDNNFAGFESKASLPTHVINLARNGDIINRLDLPPLEARRGPQVAEHIFDSFTSPGLLLVSPWLKTDSAKQKIDRQALPFSFGISVVCAVVGIYLGRRSSFSAQRQIIWALFIMASGIAGLLAFVSVQEWPARQRCPSCGKLRVVQNESCEHCGAGFSPPAKNGTEIFEALKTV